MSEEDEHPGGEALRLQHLEGELVRYLRRRLGWTQEELGAKTGLSGQAINHYELGRRALKPKRLAALTGAMGYSGWEVRLYRLVVEGRLPGEGDDPLATLATLDESDDRIVRSSAAEHGVLAAQEIEGRLGRVLVDSVAGALRREAERTFQVWAEVPRAEQRLLIERHPEFQSAPFIEQVCLASTRAAAKDPKLPLYFAQLALHAAERLPGSPKLRARVQGYVWAFVANARRVGVGLREADEAFGHSDRLWQAGAGARGIFLEEWRLPDLKASLRRDQRRWQESLALSDQALAEAPESARGRILVSKAFALQQMGEWSATLPYLEQAAPLVEASSEPIDLLAHRFNLAVSLTHTGKLTEARRRVAEARRLAVELGRGLDVVRCVWISGLIAGESGEREEAVAALTQVRGEFTARQMPLEAASVALDEAIYLLQLGKTQAVATLADEVAWVFALEGVREEALKALQLFNDAAHDELVTLELARQVRDRFRVAA